MKNKIEKRPLSLAPLPFDEAITDILKIKPEPKSPNNRKRLKKQISTKRTA